MPKILFTGVSSRIGKGVFNRLEELVPKGCQVDLLEHRTPLKGFTGNHSLLKFNVIRDIRPGYDLAFHFAAITDTAYCQKPENKCETRGVNVGLTSRVCDCSDKVVFLSTDYVFQGDLNPGETFKETDPVNPYNFYGQTKAEAEEVVLDDEGIVIRIETMMGIPNRIVDATRTILIGEKTEYYSPTTNFFLRPANFPDFFNTLRSSIDQNRSAIYHVSCSGDSLSRAEMAELVLRVYQENGWPILNRDLGFTTNPVTKRFALDTIKTRNQLGVSFTDGITAIREHVLAGI